MGSDLQNVGVLLLSGGMDSSALAASLRPAYALAVDYGQQAATAESAAAERVALHYGLTFETLKIDARSLGKGVMAGEGARDDDPCPEWWPFRNQFLVTVAAMHAYKMGARQVIVGAVASDGDAHVDGRRGFLDNLSQLLAMQEGGISLSAPAIHMTTTELVRSSGISLDILSGTHSCHISNLACGQCRGCWKRESVLRELGLVQD